LLAQSPGAAPVLLNDCRYKAVDMGGGLIDASLRLHSDGANYVTAIDFGVGDYDGPAVRIGFDEVDYFTFWDTREAGGPHFLSSLSGSAYDYAFPGTDPTNGRILGVPASGPPNGLAWLTSSEATALDSLMSFPYASSNDVHTFWGGSSGGDGYMPCIAVIAGADTVPLTGMRAVVVTAPGGGGGIQAALYSAAGVRLAYTNVATNPASGIITLPFVAGAGVQLVGGTLYYLALRVNQNALTVMARNGIAAGPSSIPAAFVVPNSNVPAANISSYISNQTDTGPWLSVY
jgi:hypothetical protein